MGILCEKISIIGVEVLENSLNRIFVGRGLKSPQLRPVDDKIDSSSFIMESMQMNCDGLYFSQEFSTCLYPGPHG